jgi:putative transcriptional regulator
VRGLAPTGAHESNAYDRHIGKECGDVSKAGESILRGARSAGVRPWRAGFVVHVPESVDVKAIRRRLGLSQRRFAERFGLKIDAVQNWEQGRRRPEGAARAFLRVIEREPEAVERALAPKPRKRHISVSATAE